MIIFVDIDNTICETNDEDYENARPLYDKITKINDYYRKGNTIVYWTARGTGSGKNFYRLTMNQLNNWGALYHELRMGKPIYDRLICDKNICLDNLP